MKPACWGPIKTPDGASTGGGPVQRRPTRHSPFFPFCGARSSGATSYRGRVEGREDPFVSLRSASARKPCASLVRRLCSPSSPNLEPNMQLHVDSKLASATAQRQRYATLCNCTRDMYSTSLAYAKKERRVDANLVLRHDSPQSPRTYREKGVRILAAIKTVKCVRSWLSQLNK